MYAAQYGTIPDQQQFQYQHYPQAAPAASLPPPPGAVAIKQEPISYSQQPTPVTVQTQPHQLQHTHPAPGPELHTYNVHQHAYSPYPPTTSATPTPYQPHMHTTQHTVGVYPGFTAPQLAAYYQPPTPPAPPADPTAATTETKQKLETKRTLLESLVQEVDRELIELKRKTVTIIEKRLTLVSELDDVVKDQRAIGVETPLGIPKNVWETYGDRGALERDRDNKEKEKERERLMRDRDRDRHNRDTHRSNRGREHSRDNKDHHRDPRHKGRRDRGFELQHGGAYSDRPPQYEEHQAPHGQPGHQGEGGTAAPSVKSEGGGGSGWGEAAGNHGSESWR